MVSKKELDAQKQQEARDEVSKYPLKAEDVNFNVLRGFIRTNYWKPTRYISPHEYATREQVKQDHGDIGEAQFELMVMAIRLRGEDRAFKCFGHEKTFKYLDVDEYTYWTMGNPLKETEVINRAKLPARLPQLNRDDPPRRLE